MHMSTRIGVLWWWWQWAGIFFATFFCRDSTAALGVGGAGFSLPYELLSRRLFGFAMAARKRRDLGVRT